jgi:hypothetical protein
MHGRDATWKSDPAQAFTELFAWSLKSKRGEVEFARGLPIAPQSFGYSTNGFVKQPGPFLKQINSTSAALYGSSTELGSMLAGW